MALKLRSGRARAASGLRLELLDEELARRASSGAVETGCDQPAQQLAQQPPVFRCSGVPVFRCSGVPVFR